MVRTAEDTVVELFNDCLHLSVNKTLDGGKEWIRLWRLLKLQQMRQDDSSGENMDTDSEMEDVVTDAHPDKILPDQFPNLKRKRESCFGFIIPEKQMKTRNFRGENASRFRA
eukprot:g28.t1